MPGRWIHAGRLSLLYENGFVRYIRVGDVEIVRNIYFALRNTDWVTAEFKITEEKISESQITYTATNFVGTREVFQWRVKISVSETGVEFAVDGHALDNFNRNRAGICVLHPIRETLNKTVIIKRPDASEYESKFPEVISPHQPFLDITRMTWELPGSAKAVLDFEGDVFETEDQRNWSDCSFKTYSTPLSRPYPVMLKPGDSINQKVRLRFINVEKLPLEESDVIDIEIGSDSKALPKIGTDFSGVPTDMNLLKSLGFEHLRVELNFNDDSWKEKLKTSLSLGMPLVVHLIFGSDASSQFEEFLRNVDVSRVYKLAFSPLDRKGDVDKLLDTVLPKARAVFPKIPIGAGFHTYFTELNRNRFDYSRIDFVIYPAQPQAHASDSLTIIENLPAQEYQIKCAGHRNVHVGPVTMGPAFDVRQATDLGAGWMLASIKYLCEGGADSITLLQSTGWFDSKEIFPVYNTFLAFRKLEPERIIKSQSSDPLTCSSVVIDGANGRHLILINHTADNIKVVAAGKTHSLTGNEILFTR